jgi:hypothetical protein
MRRFLTFCLFFLLAPAAPAGKDVGDYLTKDGTLKHPLEILDVQGGFAGFTGTLWSVQPNGEWKRSAVVQKKHKLQQEGKLSPKQLRELATALARYDLLHLDDHGRVSANPHNVSITFGKHSCEIRLGAGRPLPDPDESAAGRYGGILRAVQELCKGKAGEPK